jgi:transposase
MVCCGTRFGPLRKSARCGPIGVQRKDLVRAAGRHVQRMQKALTQMNIQLANVLSEVSGMTGQAIVKAILAGERDAYELAALRNWR